MLGAANGFDSVWAASGIATDKIAARIANCLFIGAKHNGVVKIRHVEAPQVIESAGNKPKRIEEFIGRVATETASLSVARMRSPSGWVEPGQTPEFEEYTLVLAGMLRVKTRDGQLDVRAGEAVIVPRGEWVQYSTPSPQGAEYIAVCLPAFSPETVHRDGQ